MRIILAGDTHGDVGHVRRVLDVAAAAGVDRVFQLGDFGYREHEEHGVRFLDQAHRSALSRGVTLSFLDGNHDISGLILERYGDQTDEEGFLSVRGSIRYAPRGHTWEWDGVKFLAFGGARSVDKDWRLQEEARRNQKAARKEGYRQAAGRPPSLDGPLGTTVVEGLAADPSVSWDLPGYRVSDSWPGLDVGED